MVEQRLVDRRRPGQHGDAVVLHRAHGLLGVERQLGDQRRAGLQAGQDAGLVAEVVEERVDAQVAVVAGDLAARGPRRRADERLPVRAQHALAAAGGAGREEDVGDVVGRDGCGARVDASPRSAPRATNSSQVPSSLLDRARGRRGAGPAAASRSRSATPVGAEELAHREQQRRPGAGQDVGGLAGGVAGVQRHHHAAGVVRGQARDHPVPGVRRPDRDPVAGGHAQVDHRRGSPRTQLQRERGIAWGRGGHALWGLRICRSDRRREINLGSQFSIRGILRINR